MSGGCCNHAPFRVIYFCSSFSISSIT
jgi:hypothetical protein